MEELINKVKTSLSRQDVIDLLQAVLDKECDARNGNATTEERKYLSEVLTDLCDKIDIKERQEEATPVTYE